MKPRLKPGFVCTGECDNCPVHTWRLLAAISVHPDFCLRECNAALQFSFDCSVISKAEYDQYIEANNALYEEDDEKYICPQKINSPDYKLCANCSVCGYLKFLGFQRTTKTDRGFFKFETPEGDVKSCSQLMKKLCGVEVSHNSIVTKYNIVNRSDIDPDFIDMMTSEIITRANHLVEAIDTNEEECKKKLKERAELNQIEVQKIKDIKDYRKAYYKELKRRRKEAQLKAQAEEAERRRIEEERRKKEEQLRFVKRQNRYNLVINRLKNFATEEDLKKTSISEFTDTGIICGSWAPPIKYTGNPLALANATREARKVDEYFRKELSEYPYEEGTPRYITFRANLITRTQKKFLDNMRNCLYDIYNGKFYYSILEAPVCCRDCNDCELCKVYKAHGFEFADKYLWQNHCRELAVRYTDEILTHFSFFSLSELVDSLNNGGLKFYDTHPEIVKKLKLYLGRKFLADPDSANKYFNPEG